MVTFAVSKVTENAVRRRRNFFTYRFVLYFPEQIRFFDFPLRRANFFFVVFCGFFRKMSEKLYKMSDKLLGKLKNMVYNTYILLFLGVFL